MSVIAADTIKTRVVGAAVTTEKGLNVGGALTATSFVGDGAGLTGVASTDNIITGTAVTITNTTNSTSTTTGALQVSGGVGVALSMTVGGSLSVGGTITYEDVTNVDSVGLITARSGIQFGVAGVGGTIDGVGNAIISGITTIGTGLSFADNIEAKFGNSGDLRIYHDASNAFVAQSGVGDLYIQANTIGLRNGAGSGTFVWGQTGGAVKLYFNNSTKFETHNTGVKVTGVSTVTGDSFVGSAITMYASSGIVSATAYYGDGSNLSGAGGMWTLMASADTTGQSGNDYDIFTDFASHTDKKWWKLVFNMVASGNDFSGMGLRVKVGGAWKTSDYKWQQGYFSGTSELASNQDSQSRYSLTNGDEKWHRGEVTFFNPHATSVYHLFEYTGFSADHVWHSGNDQPWVERSAGGWVGGTGAIQALRWNQYGSTWGDVNFALFAGNGW